MSERALLLDSAVALSKTIAGIVVAPGAIRRTASLFRTHFGDGPACLIADENTWRAAGSEVESVLAAAGIALRRHVLPASPRPKPSVELSKALKDVIAPENATAVAIGSGVINDVVKYAAYQLDRPYLCVATAVSMDGYASAGAPLSERGFKKTIQCRPARLIVADLDVLSAAPRDMNGWGYSDLAGKIPAGADWIVADALGIEPIDAEVWRMVQSHLREWLGRPERILQGDKDALQGLFEGLSFGGLAMERHGSSRPASGADHQVAHLWEMEGLKLNGEVVSHGACVAIGTLSVLSLYEWLMTRDLSQINVEAVVAGAPGLDEKIRSIRAAFGEGEIAERSIEETRAKHAGRAKHLERLRLIRAAWPDLRQRLEAQLVPPSTLRAMLVKAGAPSRAADIGVTSNHLKDTILNGRFLRSRYTVLDLLEEAGLLAPAVAYAVDDDCGGQAAG
jgi:glycerol-1-phosphate dehydrogenase [NAD(P)+]